MIKAGWFLETVIVIILSGIPEDRDELRLLRRYSSLFFACSSRITPDFEASSLKDIF
jgi:hypothetical protein